MADLEAIAAVLSNVKTTPDQYVLKMPVVGNKIDNKIQQDSRPLQEILEYNVVEAALKYHPVGSLFLCTYDQSQVDHAITEEDLNNRFPGSTWIEVSTEARGFLLGISNQGIDGNTTPILPLCNYNEVGAIDGMSATLTTPAGPVDTKYNVALKISTIPNHSHGLSGRACYGNSGTKQWRWGGYNYGAQEKHCLFQGGNAAHSNMGPSIGIQAFLRIE